MVFANCHARDEPSDRSWPSVISTTLAMPVILADERIQGIEIIESVAYGLTGAMQTFDTFERGIETFIRVFERAVREPEQRASMLAASAGGEIARRRNAKDCTSNTANNETTAEADQRQKKSSNNNGEQQQQHHARRDTNFFEEISGFRYLATAYALMNVQLNNNNDDNTNKNEKEVDEEKERRDFLFSGGGGGGGGGSVSVQVTQIRWQSRDNTTKLAGGGGVGNILWWSSQTHNAVDKADVGETKARQKGARRTPAGKIFQSSSRL